MYNASETPASELVKWAQDSKNHLSAAQQDLRNAGVDPDNWDDARASWFANTISALQDAQFQFIFIVKCLKDPSWMRTYASDFSDDALPGLESRAEKVVRWTTFHATISAFEDVLRRLMRHFDPTYMQSPRSITAISTNLTSRLSFQHSDRLIELVLMVRNTIHNNGYFWPDRGDPHRLVSWNGTDYHFDLGQQVTFLRWPVLFSLVKDLSDAMRDVMTSKYVASLPPIN